MTTKIFPVLPQAIVVKSKKKKRNGPLIHFKQVHPERVVKHFASTFPATDVLLSQIAHSGVPAGLVLLRPY